jgi:hypothetical protein
MKISSTSVRLLAVTGTLVALASAPASSSASSMHHMKPCTHRQVMMHHTSHCSMHHAMKHSK